MHSFFFGHELAPFFLQQVSGLVGVLAFAFLFFFFLSSAHHCSSAQAHQHGVAATWIACLKRVVGCYLLSHDLCSHVVLLGCF